MSDTEASGPAAPHPLAQADAMAALFALLVALAAPLVAGKTPTRLLDLTGVGGGVILAVGVYATLAAIAKPATLLADLAVASGAILAGGLALSLLPAVSGKADVAYWALVVGSGILAFHLLRRMLNRARHGGFARAAMLPLAAVFAVLLGLGLWEAIDRGAAIATVPAPSALAAKVGIDLPGLWARLKSTVAPASEPAKQG
ncbi:MAG: hypothetical protein U1E56_07610 [Bauldia sp.]